MKCGRWQIFKKSIAKDVFIVYNVLTIPKEETK